MLGWIGWFWNTVKQITCTYFIETNNNVDDYAVRLYFVIISTRSVSGKVYRFERFIPIDSFAIFLFVPFSLFGEVDGLNLEYFDILHATNACIRHVCNLLVHIPSGKFIIIFSNITCYGHTKYEMHWKIPCPDFPGLHAQISILCKYSEEIII